MEENQNNPSEDPNKESADYEQDGDNLMQQVEELERQAGSYHDEAEYDTRQIMKMILAAGGSLALALLISRFAVSKKKKKKGIAGLFAQKKKKSTMSLLIKQQVALLMIAVFRKEIVKLLQKLEILDEGEVL